MTAHPSTVPALPGRRRLQALARQQWPTAALAEHCPLTAATLAAIRGARVSRTSPANLAAIRDLYAHLAAIPGPSRVAGERAAREGWRGPDEWTDIDDPNEGVDDNPQDIPAGDLIAEEAAHLAGVGCLRLDDIAARMHRSRDSLLHALEAQPDLVAYIRMDPGERPAGQWRIWWGPSLEAAS